MMDVCSHAPTLIAVSKIFGPSVAIFGAILAWLLNKFLSWCVWEGSRLLDRYELMKAVRAEIQDNMRGERYYASVAIGEQLIKTLEEQLPPEAPLAPYIALDERNLILGDEGASLSKLPLAVIEPVVAYYTASRGLGRQLLDFREPAFLGIGRDRQRAVILDTYVEGAEVIRLAAIAVKQLTVKIERHHFGASALSFLTVIVIAFFLYVAVAPARRLVTSFGEAVEWASTCEIAPESAPRRPA